MRLDIQPDRLETIHPADLADIVEHLSPEDRGAILESIDSEVAAETLSEIEPRIQARILESLDPETAAEILDEMAPDEAADILGEIDEETSEEILEEMSPEPKEDVEELLEFDERTAGGLMNTDALVRARDRHRGRGHRGRTRVAGHRRGTERSLPRRTRQGASRVSSPPRASCSPPLTSSVATLQLPDLIAVDGRRLARGGRPRSIDKYNLLTLPVVDAEGRLLGVVTADDVISLLRRS